MPANKSCPSSAKPSRGEAGFSVLELMVALLLFSALGVAVWSALAGGQSLVSRSIRLAAGTARLLQMEQYLRRTAALVRTPYWLPALGEEAAPESLRIPWLHGQAQESLYLDWREGRLQVRTRREEPGVVFGPFASVSCELFAGSPGRAAGLRISVLADAGDVEPLTIVAPFGGSPLAPGTGP